MTAAGRGGMEHVQSQREAQDFIYRVYTHLLGKHIKVMILTLPNVSRL